MAEEEQSKWVFCARCGYESRDHRILYEKRQEIYEDEPPCPAAYYQYHRLVECMGCKTIKYVISKTSNSLDNVPPSWIEETDLKVYPDASGANKPRQPAINQDAAMDDDGKLLIPASVWKMYKETIEALNANIRTLAGGGLRATVEAICLDNNVTGSDLMKKIDALVQSNLLTTAQAELLHEERYIGNAALHQLETPPAQDIEDGLGIVEGLITTIYILPSKAKRLKERREAKKKPSTKP